MNLRFLLSAVVLIATSISVVATKAIADTTDADPQPARVETIPEVFERAFFKDSKNFYENSTQRRQTHFIFGPYRGRGASYPDLELIRDAKLINVIYKDALEQQNTSDPTIRTLDLINPYATSLRQQPAATRISTPVAAPEVGTELVPEKAPEGVRARY